MGKNDMESLLARWLAVFNIKWQHAMLLSILLARLFAEMLDNYWRQGYLDDSRSEYSTVQSNQK
jgi:hypothetical protein